MNSLANHTIASSNAIDINKLRKNLSQLITSPSGNNQPYSPGHGHGQIDGDSHYYHTNGSLDSSSNEVDPDGYGGNNNIHSMYATSFNIEDSPQVRTSFHFSLLKFHLQFLTSLSYFFSYRYITSVKENNWHHFTWCVVWYNIVLYYLVLYHTSQCLWKEQRSKDWLIDWVTHSRTHSLNDQETDWHKDRKIERHTDTLHAISLFVHTSLSSITTSHPILFAPSCPSSCSQSPPSGVVNTSAWEWKVSAYSMLR